VPHSRTKPISLIGIVPGTPSTIPLPAGFEVLGCCAISNQLHLIVRYPAESEPAIAHSVQNIYVQELATNASFAQPDNLRDYGGPTTAGSKSYQVFGD